MTEFTGLVTWYSGTAGLTNRITLEVRANENSHEYSAVASTVTLDGVAAQHAADVVAFVTKYGEIWATPVTPDWPAEVGQIVPCAGIALGSKK